MAGFDSNKLPLTFAFALSAGVFAAFMVFWVWRAYRFLRRKRLLGELIYRTRLEWKMSLSTIPALLIMVPPVMAWWTFFLVRDMMGEFTENTPAWLWIGPVGLTAFSLGFVALNTLGLATRLEIRRRGLAAFGTWDVSWDRVGRVVFPGPPSAVIEHDRGVSAIACPKSERTKVAAALREAGVEVVDDPDYTCSGSTVFRTLVRRRAIWAALAVGLVVFLAITAAFCSTLAPEYAAAARLEEGGVKVERSVFHVWFVRFPEKADPTEEQLRLLHKFPQLDTLHLDGTRIDDSATSSLAALTQLHSLYLSGTDVTDKSLVHLAGMKSLRCLNLSDTQATGDGLRHLEGMRELKWLVLSNIKMTEAGLTSIGRLHSLEAVSLYNTPVQDAWLAHLSQLAHLKELNLGGSAIGDEGIEMLAKDNSLTALERLTLDRTDITDAALATLARVDAFAKLKRLSLGETKITDAGADSLTELANLEKLFLEDTQITNRTVAALVGLKHLKHLSLSGTRITEDCVETLRQMKYLENLYINDTPISEETAQELRGALGAKVDWRPREKQ